jgi:GTP cyclohydrolase II
MPNPSIRLAAEADFPCRFGPFRIYGFEAEANGKSESVVALKLGELADDGPGGLAKALPAPLVRIHSQCLTGDVFGSLRCDCRAQLEMSLERIAQEGRGLLIYEAQEGRGIGLINKLKAYQLQDAGADTVEANEQLGFEADLRTYRVAVAVLHHFGLRRVRLLSNNPGKIQALEEAGIEVEERVPCEVAPSSSTRAYLRTKKKKLGHMLKDL